MASSLKLTTYLKGLPVSKLPHRSLNNLYGMILRTLQKCPPESSYRKYTEAIIKERAAIIKSTTDIPTIEEKIGCGQVEELILQAENELLLARRMVTWKPWEAPSEIPHNQWTWPPLK